MQPNLKSLSRFFQVATLALGLFVSTLSLAQIPGQQGYPSPQAPSNDNIEYNDGPNSPTLPLRQTPPTQNSPNSVSLGVPSYYYYYPTTPYYGGGYAVPPPMMGGGIQQQGPQGGIIIQGQNGKTSNSFWYSTPIPGQIPPQNNNYPSFYGPGGYAPYYNNGGNYMMRNSIPRR